MRSRSTTAEHRAAAWAARLEVASLGPAEAEELQAWLDEDPAHGALLQEYIGLHQMTKAEIPVMAAQGFLSGESATEVRRSRWRAWSAGLAAAAVLAFAALWFTRLPQQIATLASQRREVTLNDGSRLSLNARTAVAVALRGHERQVRLESGEVYFEVAKDPARPFLIATAAGSIRVTGTKFNVRADTPEKLEVTVIEGSVAVELPAGEASSGSTHFALTAGDQLGFNGLAAGVRRLAASDALDAIAWRDGRMVCDGVPLRVALERYARYHGITIDVDPAIETLPLGGIFRLDDLDGFLRDIKLTLPVQTLRNPGRIRILPR